MATINPADYGNNNNQSDSQPSFEERKDVTTAGKKVFYPVSGSYRYSQAGKRSLEIAFVCISSESKDENGALYTERFSLSERALWKLGNLSHACQIKDSFDPENGSDVEKVLLSQASPFRAMVSEKEYNGNQYLEIKFFDRSRGKLNPTHQTQAKSIKSRYEAMAKGRVDKGWECDLLPSMTNQKSSAKDPYEDQGNSSNEFEDAPASALSNTNYDEIPF